MESQLNWSEIRDRIQLLLKQLSDRQFDNYDSLLNFADDIRAKLDQLNQFASTKPEVREYQKAVQVQIGQFVDQKYPQIRRTELEKLKTVDQPTGQVVGEVKIVGELKKETQQQFVAPVTQPSIGVVTQKEPEIYEQTKVNFFTQNRLGGCYLSWKAYSSVAEDNNMVIKSRQSGFGDRMMVMGIFENPDVARSINSDLFTDRLRKAWGITMSPSLIGNYLSDYLNVNKINGSGSMIIQINDNIFPVSINNGPEIKVYHGNQPVFLKSTGRINTVLVKHFTIDQIPLFDNYEVLVGSQAFWNDNDSIWNFLSSDPDLQTMRNQTSLYDKAKVCQQLVNRSGAKTANLKNDVSVIYAVFPSTKKID